MQLLVTCLIDALFPHVGESVVRVLEAEGLTVEFPPDQTCCGQPAFNAGYPEEAASMARHTVDALAGTEGPIVVPSGSCALMIIAHAPALLAGDPEYAARASAVAERTRELTSFLVDDLGRSDLGARHPPAKVAYHPSCHGLRGLGISPQPHRLLEEVEGLERVELSETESCCGFGGFFSVELPEVSAAMLESKLDRIVASGADLVTGGDVGCLMHLEGGLRRRGSEISVAHIAELLVADE